MLGPWIFAIARRKEAMVQGFFQALWVNDSWIMEVSRNLNDWKIREYGSVLTVLSKCTLNEDEDCPIWRLKCK